MKRFFKIVFLMLLFMYFWMIVLTGCSMGNKKERQLYESIQTTDVKIESLLIPLEEMPKSWKIGKNFVRTKHNHGQEIATVTYDPPSGLNGLYQEVIHYENAFEAWLFVSKIALLPDRFWIEEPQYRIETENSADQWVLGCRDDYHENQNSCGLVARYKDIVFYITVSSEDHMTFEKFIEITSWLDKKACEVGLCKN